ncbi:cupin domain-containing protein [Kordiimonas pumila]|uniref:Cupin domain-containing protein n=1 Tax=Kordiimonas pumila TaxID=2161677 RepID=A0ABV7D1H4_9PROT|nr:cupin domain-containing protein [Kordiimonas pumila]
MPIINLAGCKVTPEKSLPAPEKILSGHPVQETENLYTDAKEKVFVGYWSSDIGKWSIDCTGDEEYCHILYGKVCLTDDADGKKVTFVEGDQFIIPEGFKGTWETIEKCKKLYFITNVG